jgi:tellurite methyltransferase
MSPPSPQTWDARYREGRGGAVSAAEVLLENRHLLPAAGRALDLACGLGGNALLLAEAGLETHAWDYSAQALARLQALAEARGLSVTGAVRDVVAAPPGPETFDVIVVTRFLERDLAPALVDALRPSGLLFYQTFTRARVDASGPRNEAFRLAQGELLRLFAALRPVVYREEGTLGDPTRGLRNQAMLIAQRP